MQLYKKCSYANNFAYLEKKHETSFIYTYTSQTFKINYVFVLEIFNQVLKVLKLYLENSYNT